MASGPTRISLATWLLTVAVGTVAASPPELRRDLDSYFLFTSRLARVQNLSLASACNVGVNCAAPHAGSSRCGQLNLGEVSFADGAQAVGDQVFCTRPGGVLWQLFRNGGRCSEASIAIVPTQSFPPPILPGTCGPGCVPNVEALQAACGFPMPFPPCDAGAPVTVRPDQDCDGATDSTPGNGQCDLSPGTYGTVQVRNGGHLALDHGTYAVCGLLIGRAAQVSTQGTAIAIPASYDLRVGQGSQLGFSCGDVTVHAAGRGAVSFGRNATVAARLCAPERHLRLGTATSLLGRFVGDTATAGRDVRGVCSACDPD